MGSESIEDWCLKPICNEPKKEEPAPKVSLKTELQVVRLSEESQKMTMATLRAIHGDDFQLDDPSKYKDRGGRLKKTYWEDSGSLIVCGMKNYSATASGTIDQKEDHLRRFAILKLENYGFPQAHCIEAYEHCNADTDAALMLLFRKYMRLPDTPESTSDHCPIDISEQELLDLRTDERAALESIYDHAFEEKERQSVWSLKFKIDHLLKHSPSEERKARAAAATAVTSKETHASQKKKVISRCRNFERDGTCRFGNQCRFKHIRTEPEKSEEKKSKAGGDDTDDQKWFYLEVRFPRNTKYPYEAPYTFLKTTCHDIPRDILVRMSRRLYEEAREICCEGMGCVYSISERLQMDESMSQDMYKDAEQLLDPEKSLFHVDNDCLSPDSISDVPSAPLPTHYERGQTSRDGPTLRSDVQIKREDRNMVRRFLEQQRDERYRKMMIGRQKLPAFSMMTEILTLLRDASVVVISGETGCGKSTQVPQFILDNWLYESSQLDKNAPIPHVELICTQPRRISAIGVAERVADERAERVGQSIGYQIRLENKISASTRLTFCTTGILLRRLASEPMLESVTHVIVDEVHERSEESDFLLLILKHILKTRNDLKVILMSATLNADLFSSYFGGAPILDIPGRTFSVQQLFLEDILDVCGYVLETDSQYSRNMKGIQGDELMRELEYADVQMQAEPPPNNIKDENLNLTALYTRYADYSKTTRKSILLMDPMKINPELIESVLKYIVDGDNDWPKEGSILIFLPGLQEILTVHEFLRDSSIFCSKANRFVIIPLHSTLSSEEQSAVFRPAPKGKRKIVLSTNIAETSITIDDVVFVVDCGLMKEKRFDSNRNMESLDLVWVSRANALQRMGRAGRVMPGVCIHLYTGHRYRHNILNQPVPEIHRVPLEQLLLRIKTLPNFDGKNVIEILGQTLEPPTEENIVSAVHRLEDVGALDNAQNLTPLGHHLAALPVDVRIGKLMLYGAIFQCLDSVLTIAACLSNKSPFVSPFNKRREADKRKREFAICNSDHLTSMMAYKKWLDVSKRSYLAGSIYANEHFLSVKTLQMISEVKYQFLELLVSIGFVPINVPRKRKKADDKILELTGYDLNMNGNNNRLLISLLCAALYPNIVKIMTPQKSYVKTAGGTMHKTPTARDLRFKTNADGYVTIHPSSVNSDVGTFQSPFLVFQEKVRTTRIYIRECSMLPVTPLMLFSGNNLKIELHNGDFLFLLEHGWIVLKAENHQTAEMIQCLRIELLKLLQEKIRDPCLNLLHHENGRKIIQTIVYLITNNN